MSEKNTGGAAFPVATWDGDKMRYIDSGMTLRQYAAIKLRVPDSGDDWLDEMIRTALRDYFTSHAPTVPEWFSEHLAGKETYVGPDIEEALWRYHHADLMLKAREA